MNNFFKNDKFSGYNFFDDPFLETNASNFEFKHVPPQQFERIIKTVRRDRLNQQRASVWKESPQFISSGETSSHRLNDKKCIKTKSSTVKFFTDVKFTDDGFTAMLPSSPKADSPKIRIMSEDEIQNVISGAVGEIFEKNEKERLPKTMDLNKSNTPLTSRTGKVVSFRETSKISKPSKETAKSLEQKISAKDSDLELFHHYNWDNENQFDATSILRSENTEDEGNIDFIQASESESSLNLDNLLMGEKKSPQHVSRNNTQNKKNDPEELEYDNFPNDDYLGEYASDENFQNVNDKKIASAKSIYSSSLKSLEHLENVDNGDGAEDINLAVCQSFTDLYLESIENESETDDLSDNLNFPNLNLQYSNEQLDDFQKKDENILEIQNTGRGTKSNRSNKIMGLQGANNSSEKNVERMSSEVFMSKNTKEAFEQIMEIRVLENQTKLLHSNDNYNSSSDEDNNNEEYRINYGNIDPENFGINEDENKNISPKNYNQSSAKEILTFDDQTVKESSSKLQLSKRSANEMKPIVKQKEIKPSTPHRKSSREMKNVSPKKFSSSKQIKPSILLKLLSSKEIKPISPQKLPLSKEINSISPQKVLSSRPVTSKITQRSFTKSPKKSSTNEATESDNENEIQLAIFSKVTGFQEQIIELMDKLKLDLLEYSMPDSRAEQKRGEKNVTEYTARFSRNYIYQIERMVEEIRVLNLEYYKSKNSFDHYIKICGLYGLLHQALNSYAKQMKHFFLNQEPRKLDVLVNLIMNATKICVQKKIFDKMDTIVQNVLRKCNDLLQFLDELKEKRKLMSNELCIRGPKSSAKNQNFNATEDKFKSYGQPTKLSMYNNPSKSINKKKSGDNLKKPSSARKSAVKIDKCTKNKEKQGNKSKNIEKVKKRLLDSPKTQPVEIINTLIESEIMENIDSMTDLTAAKVSSTTIPNSKREVVNPSTNQKEALVVDNIIDTLQKITKQEIRQILSPLVNQLGLLLNDASPQNVEEILNKLNSEINNLTDLNDAELSLNKKTKKKAKKISVTNRSNEINVKNTNNSFAISGVQEDLALTENTQRVEALKNRLHRQNTNAAASNNINMLNEQKSKVQPAVGIGELNDVISIVNSNRSKMKPKTRSFQDEKYIYGDCMVGEDSYATLDLNHNNVEIGSGNKDICAISVGDTAATKDNERIRDTLVGNEIYIKRNSLGDESRTKNVELPKLFEDEIKQLLYDPNIQYTYITSHTDEKSQLLNFEMPDLSERSELRLNLISESEGSLVRNKRENQNKLEEMSDPKSERDIENLLENRMEFIYKISENPLYVNSNFSEPWKIVTRISEKILSELAISTEKDINFGEKSYVEDFLHMELNL